MSDEKMKKNSQLLLLIFLVALSFLIFPSSQEAYSKVIGYNYVWCETVENPPGWGCGKMCVMYYIDYIYNTETCTETTGDYHEWWPTWCGNCENEGKTASGYMEALSPPSCKPEKKHYLDQRSFWIDEPEVCDSIDNNCDGIVDDTCAGDGGGGGDDKQCGDPGYGINTSIGSSSNLASGNLYHSQQVLSSHGTGLTAEITISYNSFDTTIRHIGRGWTHNYDINITNYETTIVLIEEDGRRVYFYNDGDSTYSPDASSGRHATITKNPDATYTLTEKSGIKYDFDSSGKLTNITDRNNNTLSLTYTGNNLTLITDPSGRQTTLTYDANNKITSITDPAGRASVFTYNGDFLSTVTDPIGATWTYTYDVDGRMLTKTDPLGHTFTYSYDAYGKLISSQDPEGNTKTISYDQTNQKAYITEKNGTQWTYVYDNLLNVPTEVIDPSANKTTYQYDSNRNLISKTEPDGRITTYTYHTDGNMLSKTEVYGTANQRTTTYTYNQYGQVLTITDPDSNVTTYTYDANGNLLQEKDTQNNITSHTYGSNGEKLTTTDPNGNTTTYTYDQYGNVASVTNALGQTTTYVYDIIGNLLSTTDANGNTTTYEYDLKDRLIRETKPDGGVITYGQKRGTG
jgi:YD repeat-containing protein